MQTIVGSAPVIPYSIVCSEKDSQSISNITYIALRAQNRVMHTETQIKNSIPQSWR
jgi:hypothetical protein